MLRIFIIGLIWAGCAIAWLVLGGTIVHRTGESSYALLEEVHRLWGPPVSQLPPSALYREVRRTRQKVTNYTPDGRAVESMVEKDETVELPVPLEGTELGARLSLEHRRKGLLWFPTYAADFRGRYAFRNPTGEAREVELHFPIARDNAGLDGFEVLGPDLKPVPYEIRPEYAVWTARFEPDQRREYTVAFRTRGTSRWEYQLAAGGQVKDFRLALETDFDRIDFSPGSISPTRHQASGGRWSGLWEFKSLITSNPVSVELPQRLNPGPVASRITFFAPAGLLFFFFVVSTLAIAQGRSMHPANYFFFGCAFFAFHLLFAYLVDHLPVFPAFALASAVSVFLVVSYARLFVGWRFSLREMGLSQLIYLVLFSFTFFWEGFTGLAITVGAVLTLFAMMQVTGRMHARALPRPMGVEVGARSM